MNRRFLCLSDIAGSEKEFYLKCRAGTDSVPASALSPARPFEPAAVGGERTWIRPCWVDSVLLFVYLGVILFLCYLTAHADSLWHDQTARSMFADKRARSVGDLVTIVVQEDTSATKDNSTKTSRKTDVDASVSTFLYPATVSKMLTRNGQMPAMKFDSANSFDGSGAINNSEKLVGRIAVRVVDVLPNRDLVLEGTRETAFSGEEQTMILRGVVRPDDIAANNTVFSYNLADVSIKFVSKGTISDNQRKGWAMKVWEKLSPF